MHMTLTLRVLGLAAAIVSAPAPASEQCLSPAAFFGQSMDEARRLLGQRFARNWSENGPVCADGYTNLMVGGTPAVCGAPFAIKRMIVGGFDVPSRTLGVIYLLPGGVERDTWLNWLAAGLGPLEATLDAPDPHIARLTAGKPGPRYGNRNFHVLASATAEGDTELMVYDLRATAGASAAMEACLTELNR